MISEMSLLRGKPIDIGICKVYPLTLGEIEEIGEILYNKFLIVLMMDRKTLTNQDVSPTGVKEFNNISALGTLIVHAKNDEFTKNLIITALSIFLHEEVTFHQSGYFYLGNIKESRILTNESFDVIKMILKKQNYIDNNQDDRDFKPANNRAKELLEKMRKAKEKIQKQNNEEDLSLVDIISIVANYSEDINLLTVWNLTVSQLYEAYLRLITWDEYHNNIILLPHVEQNSLKFKHWGSKINK